MAESAASASASASGAGGFSMRVEEYQRDGGFDGVLPSKGAPAYVRKLGAKKQSLAAKFSTAFVPPAVSVIEVLTHDSENSLHMGTLFYFVQKCLMSEDDKKDMAAADDDGFGTMGQGTIQEPASHVAQFCGLESAATVVSGLRHLMLTYGRGLLVSATFFVSYASAPERIVLTSEGVPYGTALSAENKALLRGAMAHMTVKGLTAQVVAYQPHTRLSTLERNALILVEVCRKDNSEGLTMLLLGRMRLPSKAQIVTSLQSVGYGSNGDIDIKMAMSGVCHALVVTGSKARTDFADSRGEISDDRWNEIDVVRTRHAIQAMEGAAATGGWGVKATVKIRLSGSDDIMEREVGRIAFFTTGFSFVELHVEDYDNRTAMHGSSAIGQFDNKVKAERRFSGLDLHVRFIARQLARVFQEEGASVGESAYRGPIHVPIMMPVLYSALRVHAHRAANWKVVDAAAGKLAIATAPKSHDGQVINADWIVNATIFWMYAHYITYSSVPVISISVPDPAHTPLLSFWREVTSSINRLRAARTAHGESGLVNILYDLVENNRLILTAGVYAPQGQELPYAPATI